ncbi:MAG TPA: hypothetical protein VK791_03315 [bacterium]|nr:hypothetical protein [bacterium]
MKHWVLYCLAASVYILPVSFVWAAPVETPSVTAVPTTVSDAKDDDDSDEPEKPFIPHWTGQLGASYSNQPSQQGQGQIQRQLSLTGTYNFTESGHYASVGLAAGKQMVEGSDSNYGQLNLDGGLGLGFFQPSLAFQFQRGESALNSFTSTLTLDFQLWDPFTIGLIMSGGLQSQQGPLSQVLGTTDTTVEIDSRSYSSGLMAEFVPWDFLTLSLTASNAYSNTYQIQNVKRTVAKALDQTDNIPSLTLGTDITFLTDFTLALGLQAGYENLPAGTVYSPILGKTVDFSAPSTQNFTGYSFGLTYSFK